ncbi:MAG: PQQ-dependent sugar dehydrogenase, partial [Alkalispirochaeta sp.]
MRLKSLTFRNRNRNRRRDGSRMTWTLLLFAPFALFVPAKADHLAAQQFSDRIVAEEDSSLGPLALREVVTGLDHPWAVAVLPNGDFLITERPGRLLYVATGGDRHISVV